MDKLKFIVIGAFLLCPMCSKGQLYYTHDSSGNLVSVKGNSWGTFEAQGDEPAICTNDSTFINISYDQSNSKAYISIVGENNMPCDVFLYDVMSNQLIDQKSFNATAPSLEYDLSTFPRGIYVIEAICSQDKKTLKISKQ